MSSGLEAAPPGRARWLAWFGLLVIALVAGGWLYYRSQAAAFHAQADGQLRAIVQLKVDELVDWRRERLSDARFFQNSLSLARTVDGFLADSDNPARADELRAWFDVTQRSHEYGVFLVDAGGTVRLSMPDTQTPLEAEVRGRARQVIQSGQSEFVDFYRSDATEAVHLAVVLPVRPVVAGASSPAALVWRIDPRSYLYPLLRRWPIESGSAELLLVRREGDEVVFVNPSRGRGTEALVQRISLAQTALPSVRAVLGLHGTIETTDSRGVPVLAVTAPVEGTPWALVAQIDQREVFAPLATRLWTTTMLIGALILASGSAIGFMSRQQEARHYRSRLRTERELREKADALHDADELLRFHLENSPLAVIEWDSSFRVMRWSARAEAVFGWPADQVMGRRPTDWGFVHPDDMAGVNAALDDLLSGRKPRSYHPNRNFTRDGRTIYCEWFNSVRLDARGERSSILSLALDVSDRVQAEQALRALNEELEQRVGARTTELEARNRELEVFTYSVSHDLKAPLRGIEGYSRLLVDEHTGSLNDEARLFLANIRQSAANMTRLIDDLLAYSQIERQPTRMTRVALRAVVAKLVADRDLDLQARGAAVRQQVPDASVVADEQALSIALGNLLDNAIKFHRPAQPPDIQIGADVTDAITRLWVRDEGIGFDMKYEPRLFDIFQRLHRVEDFPGTGVGLAIVRKSMERMGGRVRAESRPGEGATFFLEWPA